MQYSISNIIVADDSSFADDNKISVDKINANVQGRQCNICSLYQILNIFAN